MIDLTFPNLVHKKRKLWPMGGNLLLNTLPWLRLAKIGALMWGALRFAVPHDQNASAASAITGSALDFSFARCAPASGSTRARK